MDVGAFGTIIALENQKTEELTETRANIIKIYDNELLSVNHGRVASVKRQNILHLWEVVNNTSAGRGRTGRQLTPPCGKCGREIGPWPRTTARYHAAADVCDSAGGTTSGDRSLSSPAGNTAVWRQTTVAVGRYHCSVAGTHYSVTSAAEVPNNNILHAVGPSNTPNVDRAKVTVTGEPAIAPVLSSWVPKMFFFFSMGQGQILGMENLSLSVIF